MLARSQRLHVFSDVSRVLRRGIARHTPLMTLKWHPNTLPANRVGCIVSNKISKRAVVRNKIKRWLREAARMVIIKDSNLKEQNADVILIAKETIVNASLNDVVQTLRFLWEKRDHVAYPKTPIRRR